MFKILLRTHFSKFGGFNAKAMSKDALYKPVLEAAKKSNLPLAEFCFRELGYIADSELLAQQRYKSRCKFARGTQDSYNADSSNSTKSTEPFYFKEDIKTNAHEDLIRTLVNFLENTDYVCLGSAEGTNGTPVFQVMHALRFIPRKDLKLVLDDSDSIYNVVVNAVLNNAIQVPNLEASYAIAGKLHMPVISDLQKPKIVRSVLKQIATRYLDVNSKHFTAVQELLYCYDISDLETSKTKFIDYLKLVDLAAIYDCTIQELIELCGFRFVDQFTLLAQTGYFLYPLADNTFKVCNPYDDSSSGTLHRSKLKEVIAAKVGV